MIWVSDYSLCVSDLFTGQMKETLWSRLSRFFPCFSIPAHTADTLISSDKVRETRIKKNKRSPQTKLSVTFDIELGKLQLLLVVPQEEMEVLPCDFLLVIKACGLHHGLDAVLGLAL